jgi:16S rRNA (guanine1207-N2)-methyltransferase
MAHPSATDPRADALTYFFSRVPGALARPGAALVFRAVAGAYLDPLKGRPLTCLQTDKPAADALAQQGIEPLAEPPETPAALCLVLGTKHKEEVLYHYARAASLLEEGGILVGVAANDLGAPSLERRCAELMGDVETYSKHKCRVFMARKDSVKLDTGLMAEWLRGGDWRPIGDTGLVARPGMFSWKAIDPGSRLLARHLPDNLAGRGADLGAGYGYLSRELLSRSAKVKELHLFEAERKALDAAARNLADVSAAQYHWADVATGLPVKGLDFMVMNPPFHAGKQAVPALGQAFVRVALAALRPGGRLFMVANRHLPYEQEIESCGATCQKLAEAEGFKVIQAIKR